jgi:hypothetical protein
MTIQAADPALRRRVAIILGVAVIVLIAVFWFVRHWLIQTSAHLSTADLISTIRHALSVCITLIVACLLLMGRHLLLRGRRIMRDRRYPANDARVLRDTPIREGEAAVRIGNASRVAGLIACLLGLATAIVGWQWLSHFA